MYINKGNWNSFPYGKGHWFLFYLAFKALAYQQFWCQFKISNDVVKIALEQTIHAQLGKYRTSFAFIPWHSCIVHFNKKESNVLSSWQKSSSGYRNSNSRALIFCIIPPSHMNHACAQENYGTIWNCQDLVIWLLLLLVLAKEEGLKFEREKDVPTWWNDWVIFRCAVASLYEVVSVRPSVRPSVRRSVRPSVCPVLFSDAY